MLPQGQVLPRALAAFEPGPVLRWVETSLVEDCAVDVAHSLEEVRAQLESGLPEVVLADASFCTPLMLAALDAHGLTRQTVFLARSGVALERIQRRMLRHEFSVVPMTVEREGLREHVHALLYPRSQTRYRLDTLSAQLSRPDGSVLRGQVLDLSNRGFSIIVDSKQGALLPGEVVSGVALYGRNGVEALSGPQAVVRHIQVQHGSESADGSACYKVGLEMRPPSTPARQEPEAVVTDPTRIEALLREGIGESVAVRSLDVHRPRSARLLDVDGERREFRLSCDDLEPIEAGDIVLASFEFRGGFQSFHASVRATQEASAADPWEYTLKLPRAITFETKRRTARIRPSPQQAIHVELVSPFDGKHAHKEVLNITSLGLAFAVSEGRDLFPVGTRLEQLSIVFDGGEAHQVSGIVKSLTLAGSGGDHVCGVEFDALSNADNARLAAAIARTVAPELRGGHQPNFDEIWNFFLETGFLYPEKLGAIEVGEAEETMRRLLTAPTNVFKAALFGSDERIDAHVSGVKVYDNTWMVQHMAARPGGKRSMTRGRELGLTVFRYIEQLPESEWLKVWYRPENRWPRRVCGDFARTVEDPSMSCLRTYHYLVDDTLQARELPRSSIEVERATPEDLADLEAVFVSRGDSLLLRSDDISRDGMRLGTINDAFSKAGLERRREVLVARQHGRPVGFALVELSSNWLNLSQLTSAFRLVGTEDSEVQAVLIEHAKRLYRAFGARRCIGLAEDSHLDSFTSSGFQRVKRYCCWTWRRSLHQAFREHVKKVGSPE